MRDVSERGIGVVDVGGRREVVLPDVGRNDRKYEGVIENESISSVPDPGHRVRGELEPNLGCARLENSEGRNALRGCARPAIGGPAPQRGNRMAPPNPPADV